MIVVMPNGRAQKNDRAEGNVFELLPHLLFLKETCSMTSFPPSNHAIPSRRIGDTGRLPGCRWAVASR